MKNLTAVIPIAMRAQDLDSIREMLSGARMNGIECVSVLDLHCEDDHCLKSEFAIAVRAMAKNLYYVVQGGPGEARNLGLLQVKTELVTFWDSDDKPNLENLNVAIGNMPKNVSGLVGQFSLYNQNTGIRTKGPRCESVEDVARHPGLWRFVFTMESIKGLTFPKINMGEDQVFLEEYLNSGPALQFVESDLYEYRIGGNSQITVQKDRISDLIIAIKYSQYLIKEFPNKKELYEIFLVRQSITFLKNVKRSKRILYSLKILIQISLFPTTLIHEIYLILRLRKNASR